MGAGGSSALLAGWGVEAALKNTEYSALDDKQQTAAQAAAAAAGEMMCVRGVNMGLRMASTRKNLASTSTRVQAVWSPGWGEASMYVCTHEMTAGTGTPAGCTSRLPGWRHMRLRLAVHPRCRKHVAGAHGHMPCSFMARLPAIVHAGSDSADADDLKGEVKGFK